MKETNDQFTQLTSLQRLHHLFKAVVVLFIICMELIYGFSLTTNIMTQFNHASTWYYLSAFITCYLIIAILFAVLCRKISNHLMLAVTGLSPAGQR